LQTRCSFSFNIRTAVTGGDANESAGRFCNSLCRHRYTSVGKTSWSNPRSPALSGNKYVAVCAIFGSPRVRSNRPFKAGRPGPVVYPSRAMTTPRPVSWAGAGLRCQGAEAVGSLEAAMRLSPHDPYFGVIGSFRAFAHFMAGDYAAGLDWGRRAVRQNPEITGSWRGLALSAAMLDYLEEAKEAVAKARQLQPDYSVAWVERASPLVHAADRARYCDVLRPVELPEQ